jgi:hypothetical protein
VFKTYLQNFEVLDVLVFEVGLELDLLQGHRAGKEHVHELAVCATC